MANRIFDCVIKKGSYKDKNGEEKINWEKVGAVFRNDDNSVYILMDRTFNPAGVINPDNKSSVLISCFAPKENTTEAEK